MKKLLFYSLACEMTVEVLNLFFSTAATHQTETVNCQTANTVELNCMALCNICDVSCPPDKKGKQPLPN